jgi:hypothetical protein
LGWGRRSQSEGKFARVVVRAGVRGEREVG